MNFRSNNVDLVVSYVNFFEFILGTSLGSIFDFGLDSPSRNDRPITGQANEAFMELWRGQRRPKCLYFDSLAPSEQFFDKLDNRLAK